MPREYMGDAGTESGNICEPLLSNDLDCSVSEVSEEVELLRSSHTPDPRTGKLWEVRRTGLPFRPRPSLAGLPGAPSGSLALTFLGTTIWQLLQTSLSVLYVLLGLLPPKPLSDVGRLGKYGLCEGDLGLVGGVSKGEVSCGIRPPSLSVGGWSYRPL